MVILEATLFYFVFNFKNVKHVFFKRDLLIANIPAFEINSFVLLCRSRSTNRRNLSHFATSVQTFLAESSTPYLFWAKFEIASYLFVRPTSKSFYNLIILIRSNSVSNEFKIKKNLKIQQKIPEDPAFSTGGRPFFSNKLK